ncbi:MAG: potassium channel family protein [Dehalococcoidia bacterium]|jgi:Trk K+ transport system NAD-binding subunit
MAQREKDKANSGIQRLKRVAVIGCGSFGTQIAVELSSLGNIIIVVDKDPDSFSALPSYLLENSRVVTSIGDGTRETYLRQAGVQDVDLFIAATKKSSVNLLSAQLARHVMRIPEVMCLVNDSLLIPIYESLGINVINPDALLMDVIREGLD